MFFKKEKTITKKAKEANNVLVALGIESHTTSGRELREAIAMEIIGQKYEVMDKHSKASFVKQNHGVLGKVRDMLIEEGVLSKPMAKPSGKEYKK